MPWRKRKYDGDGDEDAPAKKEKPTWTTPLKNLDVDLGDTYWEVRSLYSYLQSSLLVF